MHQKKKETIMCKNRFSLLTILGLLAVFLAGGLDAEIHPLPGSDLQGAKSTSVADGSTPVPTPERDESVSIYYDLNEAAIVFAAQDLKRILGKLGTTATRKPLSDLSDAPAGTYIVIAKSNADLQTRLTAAGGQAVGTLGDQEYALRVTGSKNTKGYWALGGDRIGAMYGGIHIGEIVAGGSLANLKDQDKTPYIHKRGLKFNIPLDKRTPSFDDGGASARTNRDDVWDLDFWKEYLDVIARQRFNVLSLWVRHPFPSIVKVPGYEEVALNDGVEGDNGKKTNYYTIDQKIEHWRQVLEMAYERGIECWFVTWNIHTHGTEHTGYGWSQEPEDEPYLDESYKDYLKASVLAYFRTYPRMAGIGITAGENMRDKDDEGLPDDIREQWLWDTYGEAVMQIKQEDPSRKIRFVHRHWLSDYAEIADRFDRLPDGFEFCLKYSQARLYSSTSPPHAYKKLGKIANDKASWWNLRNDDIFIQRWGDPDFVKDFILNLPNKGAGCDRAPCITAGYVMGSDRYFWGRESMSKTPQTPRQLENEKHWYKFLLWGRLGYDPHTSKDLLKGLIQYRFPTVNASKLFDAWQAASRVIPMVNRFHYLSWDYQWWVEKGTGNSYSDIDGYHNINAIITYKSKDISTVPQDKYIYTSIEDHVKGDHYGISPLVVADSLEANGNAALSGVAGMRDGGNIELKETLGDIRSQAHFGLYWAHKIRGGLELERFRNTKNNEHKDNAIEHLQRALGEWKNYAAQLDASYEKVRFSGHGVFDWDALTADVENDINIARNAK